MSVHNGARHLRESIQSILDQTFTDWEFIIIDDGSTDATPVILAETARLDARVRLLTCPDNLGLTRALNLGLAMSQADFIARQDADDISEPQRLATQVEYLDRHPEVSVVGSGCRVIDDQGRQTAAWTYPQTDTAIRWQLLFHNAFIHTAVMARREAVSASGGYDETLPCSQDMDLWWRLMQRGSGANLDQMLVRFRRHEASISRTRGVEQQRIATRLALEHMRDIAPDLSIDERTADYLRDVFMGMARTVGFRAMRDCRLFFRLLDALARQPGIDPAIIAHLRQALVEQLAISIPVRQAVYLLASGLVCTLLCQSPAGCLKVLRQRLGRRLSDQASDSR